MLELRTAQFAEVYILGEKFETPPEENLTGDNRVPIDPNGNVELAKVKVGIALNLTVNSTLGSGATNVIGTPLPILYPGYFQATISMAKATLDLKAFSTMANINPFTAYIPSSYDFANNSFDLRQDNTIRPLASITDAPAFNPPTTADELAGKLPRFVFGIAVYDRIQDGFSRPLGIYIAMVQTVGQTLQANDAVIVQNLTAVAKPVVGGWTAVIDALYENSPFFGYTTKLAPKRF